MSSRFGPRPVGTDGTDFKHRERVAQQYNQSPLFKRRIRTVLYLQISVWLLIVAKLLPELCIRFGFVSKTFARKSWRAIAVRVDERKLEAFNHYCLRTILRGEYTDFVSNETVRARCDNIVRITQAG
nr:unnamed protein product [Spirometra erinaceieuropaei]